MCRSAKPSVSLSSVSSLGYIYGSRSKTHARLFSNRVTSADMDACFAAVAKGRESAAKGSRKV